MLFKSALAAAVLLSQTLAAPSQTIKITIDIQDGAIISAPQTPRLGLNVHVQPLNKHIDLPVFANNASISEIKKDLKALEKQANETTSLAGSATKGDKASLEKVINSVGLQALGYLNLLKNLNGSNIIHVNDTEPVGSAYWNMSSAVFAELRAIVKHNQTLCASNLLASFVQNLDSLSSSFVAASEELLLHVLPCAAEEPLNPACIFRNDIETAKAIIPFDIDDTKAILDGGEKGCPYSVTSQRIPELK